MPSRPQPHKGAKTRHAEYGENKKNVVISITPSAIAELDSLSDRFGISRSELVERFARGMISPQEAKLLGEPLAS
ncbi:ribbon-helix-helix domain-containing protein [Trichormus variabilis ARAD]|uniref:Ribbon-helix-helix domain-containing protein n=1 Tax=Trichormus variabilis N2B TaxID=2681315 RepID=A0ABR6S8G0_ANAVA|nr:ribbon-helix-helix domain-containing protein [Trichormus variabilis ARAD]MBC1258960.1 ribbon-helix-helix domain-containing protein [Trichormus variabilis V5]MBC1302671.1 ribbon-helix-helix domain-containing protein [Trichormus variabilis N2B]MBC1324526.1 ribbon-helix-helix domain-containing protein [Trichormus variabilis 9RC]QHD81628.1 ribbon-helix-helix domain-containing protein [Trichormus variabilis 0441]